MAVSIPYAEHGRTNQKQRTRTALIEAAHELVAQSIEPTVEEAAAVARISRTTAYRYFPNQAELLAAAYPEIERSTLLPAEVPSDPEARFELAIERLTDLVLATETQERAMLRLSLEVRNGDRREPLLLRQGRTIGWIEEALEPLREELGDMALRRLVFAVRSAVGVEPLVWLTDVARLPRDEAVSIMRWNALALLRLARAEGASGTAEPDSVVGA